jgi:hypothetical protein
VVLVVTNTSGTYSNANWTFPDGIFVVDFAGCSGDLCGFHSSSDAAAGSIEVRVSVARLPRHQKSNAAK